MILPLKVYVYDDDSGRAINGERYEAILHDYDIYYRKALIELVNGSLDTVDIDLVSLVRPTKDEDS